MSGQIRAEVIESQNQSVRVGLNGPSCWPNPRVAEYLAANWATAGVVVLPLITGVNRWHLTPQPADAWHKPSRLRGVRAVRVAVRTAK